MNAASIALPNDLWRHTLAFLEPTNKAPSLVSRQLLALWREGVLGLHIFLPSGHGLRFLAHERFNRFPGLRFVAINSAYSVNSQRQPKRDEQALQGLREPPGIALHLNLKPQTLPATSAVLLDQPDLAARVTHLKFKGSPPRLAGAMEAEPQLPGLLAVVPGLHSLKIDGHSGLTDEQLTALAPLPSLRHFGLKRCDALSGEGLEGLLAHCPSLESLTLALCNNLRGEALRHLAQSPGLQKLTLFGCHQVTANHFAHLGQCPSIRHLVLRNQSVGTTALATVAQQMPDLQVLAVHECVGPDDTVFKALAGMPQLSRLDIKDLRQISAEGLRDLVGQLPALTQLVLRDLAGLPASPPTGLRNASGQPVDVILER